MIMKLTGLRDLVWAPSDPRGFDHNSISKQMRLMRKKSLTWLRKIRIFYHFKRFEMVKNAMMCAFWRRKSFISVVKVCFLLLWLPQISHHPRTNYLAVKKHFKKILNGFKSDFCFQKIRKVRIFYHFSSLEMLKMPWCVRFGGANHFMFLRILPPNSLCWGS